MIRRMLLTLFCLIFVAAGAAAERIEIGQVEDDVAVTVIESNSQRTVIRCEIGAFERNAENINNEEFFKLYCGDESTLLR